jgi:phospho-acceptor domain-containing protein
LLGSAAVISVVVIVSGLAVGRFFEHDLLAREAEHAVKVVQTQARQHLVAADFDLARSPGAQKAFEAFIPELPGIVRIKVYDGSGGIVWPDQPGLVGKLPGDRCLASALGGTVATGLKGPVAEACVPVTLPRASGVVGVIRTYRDVGQEMLEVRRAQRAIWAAAGAMGVFLYGAFALIVWNASRKEQRAVAAITQSADELRRANQALRDTQAQLVEKERLTAAGQIVVGLHHEILNPLTGIVGALQVLKQDGITQAAKARALTEAEVEIRKIERLVRRLPTLCRATGTPYVGRTTMIDLEDSFANEELT